MFMAFLCKPLNREIVSPLQSVCVFSPCAWSWCKPTTKAHDMYNRLVHSIRSIDTENLHFYIYQPAELHCTIATLSNFKNHDSFLNTATSQLRKAALALWKDGKRVYDRILIFMNIVYSCII